MSNRNKLRDEILQKRGVEFQKHTRKTVSILDKPVPFKKTNTMTMLELRFKKPIESIIFTKDTIYELEKKLSIDATTISKWRTLIRKARDKEFWDNFNKEQS